MPPKGRGRSRDILHNGRDHATEEVIDVVSLGDASDASSVVFTGRRVAPRKHKTATSGAKAIQGGITNQAVPGIYQDLLHEALESSTTDTAERPRKRRRRAGEGSVKSAISHTSAPALDEEVTFEDVLQQQSVYQDTSEASGSDVEWESHQQHKETESDEEDGDLDLVIQSKDIPPQTAATRRRNQVSKGDKALHLNVHKLHVLCLISSISIRNSWCNDETIQNFLLPLVNDKIMANLRPENPHQLSQFRRTDLLITGLNQLIPVWNARFTITARGFRKALWAENEDALKNFRLPVDAEEPMDKSAFEATAKSLRSSRDVGALLFCALLRGCGLETRLVTSLQALPFNVTVNTTAQLASLSSPAQNLAPSPDPSLETEPIDIHDFAESGSNITSNLPFTAPRRRLGGAHLPEYHLPDMYKSTPVLPSPSKPKLKAKHIRESSLPTFWVEVLDEAHSKWMTVDPMVTRSVGKPQRLEPPASDPENTMAYVLAFEDDYVIRDVTIRYAKAFNAKTRKLRVDSIEGGEIWWSRLMKLFARTWTRDVDTIEDSELAGRIAREPLPKNIADFKGHPVYALERHLRINEVLVARNEVARVPARGATARAGKTMEAVYRRSDVKVARSADRWYRLGRDVKAGVQPIKVVPAKKTEANYDEPEEDRDEIGTGLYTEEQTELYVPPPIVNGRVPRNTYGNLDIYVPTMVPRGGSHIPFDDAKHAAQLLGVNFAEAVTGFKFQGRRGTPIVNGIVAASEYREAILAVIEGFRDERRRKEEEMRSLAALRLWKKFLVGLRIKERVDGYEVEGEMSDHEMYDEEIGGGFLHAGADEVTSSRSIFRDTAGRGTNNQDSKLEPLEKHVETQEDVEITRIKDSTDAEIFDGGGFSFSDHQDEDVTVDETVQSDSGGGGGFFPTVHESESGDDDLVVDDNEDMKSEEYDFEDDGEGGGFIPG